MRRYIVLAAVLLAFTGCNKAEEKVNDTPAVQANAETVTETTTADEIPAEVKPDTADIRTYCVKLDAARNEIIGNYKDKIPEKLRETFDANSSVLDEYMDKAAADLSEDEAERIFNALKNLEIFFCETMAKEIGAGDKITEVALAATNGADYYFEKIGEANSEETTAEGESEETTENGEDGTQKDGDKDNKEDDGKKDDSKKESSDKDQKDKDSKKETN